MNDETSLSLSYVEENLQSAEMLLASRLWNPCLQNAQQAVEKFLKALLIAHALPLKRTHTGLTQNRRNLGAHAHLARVRQDVQLSFHAIFAQRARAR